MMTEHSDAAMTSDAGSVPESKTRTVTVPVTDGASNDKGYVYCIAEDEGGKESGYFTIGIGEVL